MGFIDGFLDKMKLGSNYDDDEEYDDYDDEDQDDEASSVRSVRARSGGAAARRSEPEYEHTPEIKDEALSKPEKPARQTGRSASRTSGGRVVAMQEKNSRMEVCVIKPNNIEEDGREIAETLLSGRAVVLNLEGLDMNLAQRISDFTSGACYSIHGNLQRISNYIFIVTPRSIDVSGDFQELLSGGEFSFGPDFKL